MNRTLVLAVLVLGLVAPPVARGAQPIAVVELFTSEGCSSCPPADRLLSELDRDARKDGTRVYAIEWHVDYWNHLGWKDPYSDAAYSRRQDEYDGALGGPGIYTPQMIVNGTDVFVGSNSARAHDAIDRALSKDAIVSMTATYSSTAAGVHVTCRAETAPAKTILHAVLLESGLRSQVVKGENGGRTLVHDDVVRAHATATIAGGGAATFDLRGSLKGQATTILVFAQDPKSMAILGASRAVPAAH